MTPMWILARDLARRHPWLLTLGPLSFSALFLLFLLALRGAPNDPDSANIPFLVLAMYFLLASNIAGTINSKVARVWRTLPLRHSSSATLAWGIAKALPPLLVAAPLLPLTSLLAWLGATEWQSLSSVVLFLVFAVLLSGLFAFNQAVSVLDACGAATLRKRRVFAFVLVAHRGKAFLSAFVIAGMMLYRAPWHWSNLTPRHLLGMCLAAGMTWASYQIRYSLLQPTRETGDRPYDPSTSEKPLKRAPSYPTWLGYDLLRTLGQSALLLPVAFCAIYLLMMWVATQKLTPFASAAGVFPLICAITIFAEIDRIGWLKVLRTLPLTANQSIFLLLAYPYALTLVALPSAVVLLWVAGLGQGQTVLLCGGIFIVSALPFVLFLRARFGYTGAASIIALAGFVGIVVLFILLAVFNSSVSQIPGPILLAGMAISPVVALASFSGLRYLIENSSMLYRRNLTKQEDE